MSSSASTRRRFGLAGVVVALVVVGGGAVAAGAATPSPSAPSPTAEAPDEEESEQDRAADKAARAADKAARAADKAARKPPVTGPAFVCDPALTHGQNVSAYARSLPKGPGRGRLVSQAARSDCGKPSDAD